jgi:3'(2'), 5'-bisphosphate nucleotidase
MAADPRNPNRSIELAAALAAVRAASALTAGAQGRLAAGDTLTKGDESPVTVADFAAQAIVCATLTDALGEIDLVGEEDSADLCSTEHTALRDGVVELVQRQRGDDVSAATVLDWISVGTADGTTDRYWTLDPIDGTKGFLRGDQYAIALALIEDGEVTLGVLGCPNLPNPDGTTGAVFVAGAAVEGRCVAYQGTSAMAVPARVAAPPSLAHARFCESVESGHSDQNDSARIAGLLGITAEPYRIDSQCKYAAVARGDASIYLRLPTRADYREKIWDHAAGKFVVEQAGGRVTDVTGASLDFTHGTTLEQNRGVIATDGRFHDEVLAAVAAVLDA